MSFEQRRFKDGEPIYDVPNWKSNLEKIEQELNPIDFQKRQEEDKWISESEVGIKHPKNGSFLRIKDDGTIEAFTKYGTGIRIKKDSTIQLYSDRIQTIGREISIQTKENGLTFNGKKVGEESYASYPRKRGISKETLNRFKDNGIETNGLEDLK